MESSGVAAGKIFLRVDSFQRNAAERGEALLAFARCGRFFGGLDREEDSSHAPRIAERQHAKENHQ